VPISTTAAVAATARRSRQRAADGRGKEKNDQTGKGEMGDAYLDKIHTMMIDAITSGALTLDSPLTALPYIGPYLSQSIQREIRAFSVRELLDTLTVRKYTAANLRVILGSVLLNKRRNTCVGGFQTRVVNKYGYASVLGMLRGCEGEGDGVYRLLDYTFDNPHVHELPFPVTRTEAVARCGCVETKGVCEGYTDERRGRCGWNIDGEVCIPGRRRDGQRAFEGLNGVATQFVADDEGDVGLTYNAGWLEAGPLPAAVLRGAQTEARVLTRRRPPPRR
jgi:hypothetical protein